MALVHVSFKSLRDSEPQRITISDNDSLADFLAEAAISNISKVDVYVNGKRVPTEELEDTDISEGMEIALQPRNYSSGVED